MRADKLLQDNPLRIVDIGASGGIDARWAKFTHEYQGILFEPDPREFERLKSASARQLVVLNSALFDSASTIAFHLCQKQQVSSVYFPNTDFLARFPKAERYEITRTVQMATDTLDSQLALHAIDDIDFIKMDTQGCELPILLGGRETLERTVGMQIEVAFSPSYLNQPLFSDVDTFVRARGFELFDIKPQTWTRSDKARGKGQLVFGDALYFRSPEQMISMSGLTPAKLIRAICVYLAYEHTDIARVLLRDASGGIKLPTELYELAAAQISALERRASLRNLLRLRRLRHRVAKIMVRRYLTRRSRQACRTRQSRNAHKWQAPHWDSRSNNGADKQDHNGSPASGDVRRTGNGTGRHGCRGFGARDGEHGRDGRPSRQIRNR